MVTITLLTQILVVGDHKFSRAQYCVVKLLFISPPQQTCTKTNLYFLVDPFYSSVKPLRWLPLHMSHWILTIIISRPHFSFLFVIFCLFPLIYNPTHLLFLQISILWPPLSQVAFTLQSMQCLGGAWHSWRQSLVCTRLEDLALSESVCTNQQLTFLSVRPSPPPGIEHLVTALS